MNRGIGSIVRRLLCAGLLACGFMSVDAAVPSAVLTPLQPAINGIAGAEPLAISIDGKQAYVGSFTSGELSVFNRDPTGSYSLAHTYSSADLLATTSTDLLQSLAVSPDGQYLYAAYEMYGQNTALIAVLRFDSSGAPSLKDSIPVVGSTRLSGLAVSPDGKQLYAVDQDSLHIYEWTGNGLSPHPRLTDSSGGVDGLAGAWAVVVSPDGHNIYVSGSGDQAVAVFSRDSNDQINFLAAYKNGVGTISGLANASGAVISPDGKQLYVAGAGDNAVSVFSRDPTTGLLHQQQVYQDIMPGFNGLSGAFALAMSPEGSQLYVLGPDILTVLRRDGVNGALTQTAVLRQGQTVPVVDGLSGAIDLAVTPDGTQVLVSSPIRDTLAAFKVAAANLNVVIQSDPAAMTAGGTVQFKLVVTNDGPDGAGDVVVTDLLPAGVVTSSGVFGINQVCTLMAAQLQCTVGNLAAGQQVVLDISVTYPSPGSYINSAVTVAAQRDPQLGDNRTQASVQIAPSQNQGPVAVADQTVTLPSVAVDISVLANDYDPDGNDFTLTALDATSQQGGTLTINSDGSVHYIPPATFHGIDSFTYTITDSTGATALGIVQVTVNTPPVAKDDTAAVVEGETTAIYVLVNDLDADGDPLSIIAVQSPSAQGGTVSANDDGTITYTPPADFNGSDTFSYTDGDGYGGSAKAQVTLSVSSMVAQAASGDVPKGTSGGQPTDSGGGGAVRPTELMLLMLLLLARRGRHIVMPGSSA